MRVRGRARLGQGAALAAAVAVLLGGLTAAPAAAAPPAASNTPSATVSMYAGNAGTETPGESVTITVAIDNTSGKTISPGTATVSITDKPLTGRAALDAWLKPGDDDVTTRVIATKATSAVLIGASSRVATFTVPAAAVGLSGGAAVYGLKATVKDAAGDVGSGYSTLAYSAPSDGQQVGLAVAMPITVPPILTGLISSTDLATYTAPDGLLTRQLQLARDHPSIAIAIDPMIIASIRVLGTSAPQSARTWLENLSLLGNDSFPLQYGDADVASELQAGVSPLMAPISFDYALDPRNFPAPITVGETPEPTPTPTTNPFVTPTPTQTAEPTNVPTTEQLLSWPYTYSGIAWPATKSLRSADIEALSDQKYPSAIVSSSNTNAGSLPTTPNAPMPVKGGTALVSDDGISSALDEVVSAATVDEQNVALSSVSAQLAEVSEQGTSGTVVLAGLGRSWPTNVNEASRALDSLDSLPWVNSSSLRDALKAPVTAGLKLTDATQGPARAATVNSLIGPGGISSQLDAFSTVLSDPTLLTAQTRNQLLSLLAVGWTRPDQDWPSAVAVFAKQASATLGSVKIESTGKVTVASTQSLIPVTVTNSYTQPVNIVLRATPSNGRLEIDSDTDKTIPASASAKVLVPVKAKLGNGSVTLGLQLYSPTGIPIGLGTTASVDVHADWEGLGALVLGIAVVLFFGFGLVRSIVRRRTARRRGDTDDVDEDESDDEHDVTEPDDAGDPEHDTTEHDDADAPQNGTPRG